MLRANWPASTAEVVNKDPASKEVGSTTEANTQDCLMAYTYTHTNIYIFKLLLGKLQLFFILIHPEDFFHSYQEFLQTE